MSPVRHALGALLLEQGRVGEAEAVYRADLAPGRHPNNVWALHGLRACLERSGAAEAEQHAAAAALRAAQADADVEIKASCACARGAWDRDGDAAATGTATL